MTLIKSNLELGFTLGEIKQPLDLHSVVAAMSFPLRHKPTELLGIIAIGRERLQAIDQKVSTLHVMRRRLASLLQQLEAATLTVLPASKSNPKRH